MSLGLKVILDTVRTWISSGANRLGRRDSADELGLERSGQPGLKLFVAPSAAADQHIVVDGTLVLAWVGNVSNGKAGDWAASQKLLAAVLQKL
jgi:hypothetical protein